MANFKINCDNLDKEKIAKKIMIENSESRNNRANSGLVMLCKNKVPVDIVKFAEKCINKEIKMEEMRKAHSITKKEVTNAVKDEVRQKQNEIRKKCVNFIIKNVPRY